MTSPKVELRRRLLARLQTVTPVQAKAAGAAISTRLLARPELAAARRVAAFAAMPEEPDLRPLLQAVLARGLALYLPAWESAARGYVPRRLTSLEALRPGHYGIAEPPADAPALPPADNDEFLLWLVPGVAFDATGRRLGRGGGYYDRLLQNVNGTKIGIAHDWQIVATVPAETHDIRVDAVATERRYLSAASMPLTT